jgi:biopolymer transport protein ExbB
MKNKRTKTASLRLMATITLLLLAANPASAWWNESWTGRTKLTIDPSAEGAQLNGAPGDTVVLVRLHPSNLPFEAIQPDGSDLRFVAGDDKTLLPFHLEKIDTLMAEGFAWVRVPAIKGDAPTDVWLYYGNASPGAEGAPDPLATYAGAEKIVYHLNERGTAPQDLTSNKSNGSNICVSGFKCAKRRYSSSRSVVPNILRSPSSD